MIGGTINQYKVLDQLGEGGMGIVYLAEDTRLHRKAALKFISGSSHVTAEERKRFDREARAAARLSHPNICTVYELGEYEEQAFIALEYVEGETLKERMRRGQISNEDIRCWLAQIAEGLLAAHEQGVVHRDVKPANIMITPRGNVKIMDFGIAKLSEVETELTQADSKIGTIAYMSPEQARGEQVDHRTDIWSLGVLLYELTTGRRPFTGAFREAVMYAMMHENVTAPSAVNPDIPVDLERIIDKCLQRERAERYGSLDELLRDLRGEDGAAIETRPADGSGLTAGKNEQAAGTRSAGTTTGFTWSTIVDTRQKRLVAVGLAALIAFLVLAWPDFSGFIIGPPSTGVLPSTMHLAVLPFDIIGDSPEDEAFSNGLAHLVATNLMQMKHEGKEMWIIPVREVLSQKITSTQAAKESFGINLAISGTILQLAGNMQITLDLTDAGTLRVVDSATIELDELDPQEVQVQVMQKLGVMLGLQAPAAADPMLAGLTEDPEAYKLYIQGQGFLQPYENPDNVNEALKRFEQAIEIDSTYALAYAGAAFAYARKYSYSKNPEWLEHALKLSEKAVALNDELAEVWVSEGRIRYQADEIESAIEAFEKALDIDPENYQAHRRLGTAYRTLREYDLAESSYKRALEIQPGYWDIYNVLGVLYAMLERWDDAIEMFEKVVELSSENATAYNNLGNVYGRRGDELEAEANYLRSIEVEPTAEAYGNLAWIAAGRKDYPSAIRYFSDATGVSEDNYIYWLNLGYMYSLVNNLDSARIAWQKTVDLAEKELEIAPNKKLAIAISAEGYVRLGQFEKARMYIRRFLDLAPLTAFELMHVSTLFEYLQERQTALIYLERAFEAGLRPDEVFTAPWLEDFAADPGYQALIDK